MTTKIEWTNQTWNPIVGCSKVSPGCDNCYAERMARRQYWMEKSRGIDRGKYYEVTDAYGWTGKLGFDEKELQKPLHWKKPRMIFVSSMGDLFHGSVPFEWVFKVLDVMRKCPQHTFQILTKRPEFALRCFELNDHRLPDNVWFGVTCENQETADLRIPKLLEIPAAVRFVSIEPGLSEIDFDQVYLGDMYCPACRKFFDDPKDWTSPCCGALAEPVVHGCTERCDECKEVFDADRQIPTCPYCNNTGSDGHHIQPDYVGCFSRDKEGAVLEKLDWAIVGAETGPGKRPMKLDWVEKIVSDCKAAGVPCFVKKLPINGKVTGDMSKWPAGLCVRQWPKIKGAK